MNKSYWISTDQLLFFYLPTLNYVHVSVFFGSVGMDFKPLQKKPIKSLKFGKDGMEWTWPKVVYLKDANSINAIKKPKSSN